MGKYGEAVVGCEAASGLSEVRWGWSGVTWLLKREAEVGWQQDSGASVRGGWRSSQRAGGKAAGTGADPPAGLGRASRGECTTATADHALVEPAPSVALARYNSTQCLTLTLPQSLK